MVNFRRRQLVNRRATAALFASMIACLLLAATPLWYFTGGASGLIFFVFAGLAIFVPLGGYWFSDRIVLAATGARVVEYADCPQIFDAVDGVRIAAGLPMPRIAIVDDPEPNAFATGRDPEHAVVAFTTGLINSMTRDEFEGVAAHEVAHVANRDTLLMSIAASVAAVLCALLGFLAALATRRDEDGKVQDGRPAAMVMLAFTPLLVAVINAGLSRRREALADATAVAFTRNPTGLRSALEALQGFEYSGTSEGVSTAHLWFSARGSWRGRLMATHPPLEQRIARLRAMEGVR